MLEVRGVGGVRSRVENLRDNLRLPKRISCGKPRLDPCVMNQIRTGNHGFLRYWARPAIDLLGRKNVLLCLWVGERDRWPLSLGRVDFEAFLLVGWRV